MHYYTYAYLREDKTPYYIGKGKGNRIYSKQKYIKPPKDKSRIIFLKQNLTEEEAFRHEIYMIDVFGRIDLGTGILHNRTDGGDGSSGAIRSDETRKKIGEANKGKTLSEETRKKMGEAKKKMSNKTRIKYSETKKGEKNPNYGKTPSKETKKKMSESQKGRTHSEETKRKLSEAHKGEKNPNYGKTLSDETKRKLSEVKKDRKWWNDGCGNRKWVVECPGDGWKPGRK